MATNVLGLHTFTASEPWDFNIVNDNSLKIDNGVKTAMQGRAAHNLLDNSDFRNPVNQRGKSSYTGSYSIDRWYASGSGSASLSSVGITVSNVSFRQFVILPAGTYTLAFKVSNGTLLHYNFTYDGTSTITKIGGANEMAGAYINLYNNANGVVACQFVLGADYSYTLVWAALYEGSYDASTLPAYQPKGYAAELAECQLYYRRGVQAVTIGKLYTAGGIFSLWFPQMRINPTINILEIMSQGWGNVDASNYTQGWGGAYGSWHYINFISSITEDVGKTIIIKYENSADL